MSRQLFEVSDLTVAIYDADLAYHGVDENLVHAPSKRSLGPGWATAIDKISFSVNAGEVLGVVGESGSGKTLSVLGAFGLNGAGSMVIDGSVTLMGHRLDVFASPEDRGRRNTRLARRRWRKRARSYMGDSLDSEWRTLMGNHVGVMFQDPVSGWSPVRLIGDQTSDALVEHSALTTEEIERRVVDALGEVHLPKRAGSVFAHQLSRGQAQRAMLASALIRAPDLLIADEPLTGLDAPVAAAILELIKDMRQQRGLAMILITHDLATVASIADTVVVVYGGRIVEQGPVRDIFYRPQHPYTEGLLGSSVGSSGDRLRPIEGTPPRILDVPKDQCAFTPRCPYAIDACRSGQPPVHRVNDTDVACIRADELTLRGVST